jgi:hypothetical protein
MYREMAYQISTYAAEFKAAGVTEDEMTSQLRTIRQMLEENEDLITETDTALAEQVYGNIEAAERVLGTVFAE